MLHTQVMMTCVELDTVFECADSRRIKYQSGINFPLGLEFKVFLLLDPVCSTMSHTRAHTYIHTHTHIYTCVCACMGNIYIYIERERD